MIKTYWARNLPYSVVNAFFSVSYSVFIAVIVPQKFQRSFVFISLFGSFRYHEYQSVIIFAVVKNLPVTELPFFFKVLVDNPQEPVNTKESSIGLPYCGFICKCYRGIDIEEEGMGGGGGTCLLVVRPWMNEVEFSLTDLEGSICIEGGQPYWKAKVTLLEESKDSGDTWRGLIRRLSLLDDLNPARALVM